MRIDAYNDPFPDFKASALDTALLLNQTQDIQSLLYNMRAANRKGEAAELFLSGFESGWCGLQREISLKEHNSVCYSARKIMENIRRM